MKRKGEERDILANELKLQIERRSEQPKLKKVLKSLKAEGKIDEILADSERRHGETINSMKTESLNVMLCGNQKARDAVVNELGNFGNRCGLKRLKVNSDRVIMTLKQTNTHLQTKTAVLLR